MKALIKSRIMARQWGIPSIRIILQKKKLKPDKVAPENPLQRTTSFSHPCFANYRGSNEETRRTRIHPTTLLKWQAVKTQALGGTRTHRTWKSSYMGTTIGRITPRLLRRVWQRNIIRRTLHHWNTRVRLDRISTYCRETSRWTVLYKANKNPIRESSWVV